MNKKALEAFAPTERTNLRQAVERRLSKLGINAKSSYKSETEWLSVEDGIVTINGISYTEIPRDKFSRLFREYKAVGYDSLVEETAYTWFNRLIAIRYMEVKGVLPDIVKIVGNNGVIPRPEILTNYQYLGKLINSSEIENLKLTDEESAYRKLFLAACNKLGEALPFLFKPLDDWMELLLPDKMLEPGGLIDRIVSNEGLTNSFEEGVEAIGWLYQFYMSEKKKLVGGLKNIAVKKEDLPVVTQLFTPRWIVEYMIENSLGKLYDEWFEENNLSQNWEQYLKHDSSEKILPAIKNLEDIKFFDPACGSGHILVAAFEYFYEMYLDQGYRRTEIPILILQKNLYGCDIDKRATQIANFAIFMKATEKDPRILRRQLVNKVNILEITDSEYLSEEEWGWLEKDSEKLKSLKEVVKQFSNGKQFGSLIKPTLLNYDYYINKIEEANRIREGDLLEIAIATNVTHRLLPVLEQAKLLSESYEIVVTNPPYHDKFNPLLKSFIEENYKDYKSDLYSSFIYRCIALSKNSGYVGMMTPLTWMYITSHETLRKYILNNSSISSFVELEYSAFEEATVPICTFVVHKQSINTVGEYICLAEKKGDQELFVRHAVLNKDIPYRYSSDCKKFSEIPGSRISAYWLSPKMYDIYINNPLLDEVADARVGLQTSDNQRFVRLWQEVSYNKIGMGFSSLEEAKNSKKKWFTFNKGGSFRRWYGNNNYVINWEDDGREAKEFATEKYKNYTRILKNLNYMFRKGITYTGKTSGEASYRISEEGYMFDVAGSCMFYNTKYEYLPYEYLLALLNSPVNSNIMKYINRTINKQVGDIKLIPVWICEDKELINEIVNLTSENIAISKNEWDSYESSWDFLGDPLTLDINSTKIADIFKQVKNKRNEMIEIVKNNQEKLNNIFIEAYGLEKELSAEVTYKDITLREYNRETATKSFLSYFIGCWLGRYSIDRIGLVFAGEEWNPLNYIRFNPSIDGIITFTDEKILSDEQDVYEKLKMFLRTLYGEKTVEENITWIANGLSKNINVTNEKVIRNYFISNFLKDHLTMYTDSTGRGKRPIYWQIDSGKENAMKSLFYLHRYNQQTLGLAMNHHFVPLLSQWRSLANVTEEEINSGNLSASEKNEKTKQLYVYKKRVEELENFQDILHDMARKEIAIDLDYGVKENYQIFESILTPIKM